MFQRDYVLRQIQQLIQVLELVIFKRKSDQIEDARDVLNGALKDVFATDIAGIIALSTAELIGLCSSGTHLQAEKAVALAEILEAEAAFQPHTEQTSKLREHAYELYSAALHTDGATLPLDIYDRLSSLS
jgi:Family of unknown function (DUF6483)